MVKFRLILSLAFFIPSWTLLGAFAALDNDLPLLAGLLSGAVAGTFFGLVFGGNPKWKVWDYIYGPEEEEASQRAEAARLALRIASPPADESLSGESLPQVRQCLQPISRVFVLPFHRGPLEQHCHQGDQELPDEQTRVAHKSVSPSH
jgi:hypothetical protein